MSEGWIKLFTISEDSLGLKKNYLRIAGTTLGFSGVGKNLHPSLGFSGLTNLFTYRWSISEVWGVKTYLRIDVVFSGGK